MDRYHGKCLKIARGKFKEDDKYTCPICDWRVKIPRDAARPKLEDLQEWQQEIPTLPFQPEEEDTLEEIINTGSKFRDFMKPYTNPMVSTPSESDTQRFYLRKIEGAEILLTDETNFFRRELHKWVPVAPTAPPMLEMSLSTRKPRPTKQQKEMSRLGITNPDDLPQHLRTKQHSFTKQQRKTSDANSSKGHHPLQPAPRRGRGRSDTPNSASMGGTRDPHTHTHRLPTAMTSAHAESPYTAYFPSPQSNNHHTGSPAFAPGPYYHNHNSHSSHSSHLDSPGFPPRSPMGRSGPGPLDPSLFSPTNNHFPSSVSGSQNQGQNHMLSPQHNPYSTSTRDLDRVFDEFTTDPSEDLGPRNEAAEALEDRRREEEHENGNRLVDEFLR